MGKPGHSWRGSKESIPAICLLVIVLVIMVHATSYGKIPPGDEPPSQETTAVEESVPADSTLISPQEPAGSPSPESVSAFKRAQENLMREDFSYSPIGMLDPFVSFIAPAATVPQEAPELEAFEVEEGEPIVEPEVQKPLTPLQRMSLRDIEQGLKAITWGELGRRALIEDSAGKGYIVSIGTLAGDKNGVVAQIFNDHLVIQQEIWDKDLKRMVPQNSVVKLWKEQK